MRGNTKTPGASTSSNGRQAAEGHVSVSHATRYLSVAPHLRRGMFRREITEPGLIGGRPPRPVGRSYAIRVRYGADGAVPMPAVDTEEVRKQCAIALLQTIIRDAAVLAVVITSAVLEPRGTAIVFGFTIAVIMLIGRVRLFSLWTIAAIVAGAVLLFTGIYRGELFLGIPLICLGACFVIYLADTVLSVYQVRRLWRKSAAGEKSGLRLPWAAPSGQAADGDKPDHAHLDDRSDGQSNTNGSGLTRGKLPVSEARLVYHDNHRIIGAGAALGPVDFTVGLEKPLRTEEAIEPFKTSDLMAQVGFHVVSQGVGQSEDFAYGIWSASDSSSTSASHFTYGLRNLNVGPVIATPVPEFRKHPILPVIRVKLNYYDRPPAEYILEVIDRSPIGQPERHYVCAIMSSWEGQLVTSVFFNAALEGHSLSMSIQPYVLGPIVPDLHVADDLATQNQLMVVCRAIAITARQFAAAAERVNRLGRRADKTDTSMTGLRSARERYAQAATDHMDQARDASRIIRVLEGKIVRATMTYLRDHNIDVNEDERQALNYVQTYTIFGDGVINTGDRSNVNYAKGDGNTQTNNGNKN